MCEWVVRGQVIVKLVNKEQKVLHVFIKKKEVHTIQLNNTFNQLTLIN